MKKALLAGALALGTFAVPASANHLTPPPIATVGWSRCTGQYDAACIDGTGAFCTLWTNYRCTVGE